MKEEENVLRAGLFYVVRTEVSSSRKIIISFSTSQFKTLRIDTPHVRYLLFVLMRVNVQSGAQFRFSFLLKKGVVLENVHTLL